MTRITAEEARAGTVALAISPFLDLHDAAILKAVGAGLSEIEPWNPSAHAAFPTWTNLGAVGKSPNEKELRAIKAHYCTQGFEITEHPPAPNPTPTDPGGWLTLSW